MTVGSIKILPLVVVAVERLTLSARLISKGAAPKTKARLSPDRESFESFILYLYAIGRWLEVKKLTIRYYQVKRRTKWVTLNWTSRPFRSSTVLATSGTGICWCVPIWKQTISGGTIIPRRCVTTQ